MEVLKARRTDLERRVARKLMRGEKILFEVEAWITSMKSFEEEISNVLEVRDAEVQRLCIGGFCSHNLVHTYGYGKKICKMLKRVEEICSKGDFARVSEEDYIICVEKLPVESKLAGQEIRFEIVWNQFMEENKEIIGLYGMGGVGKTTLLKQINNKFVESINDFDIVIWIMVSNNATVYKIQKEIGERIGFGGEVWDSKEEHQRAVEIYGVLMSQRFVLLLDDLWEKVDLQGIGIPYPSRENKCKIGFTTRSRDVCRSMGVGDPIEVQCLSWEESWSLFEWKVGAETLKIYQKVCESANTVAKWCDGLPLAINFMGEAMASRTTIQEWSHAVEVIRSPDVYFSGLEKKIFQSLKRSYDNLGDEQMKVCFLYTAMFPRNYCIQKEKLINCWIFEGLIDEKQGRERALNQGYEVVGSLIRASLLLGIAEDVRMHSLIREMALWIASDFGKDREKYIVQTDEGLCEIPRVKNWKAVQRMSLMGNQIKEVIDMPECPLLTSLLLGHNELAKISAEFFRFMPKLLVLDLSNNEEINGLSEAISDLVSLEYLDLSNTDIYQLPVGVLKLETLIFLNLESTKRLENLNGISKLWKLKTLGLKDSKLKIESSLVKELELLEHLEDVSGIISPSVVEEPSVYGSRVWKCFHRFDIRNESGKTLVLPAATTNISEVNIDRCETRKINILWDKSLTMKSFSSLLSVCVNSCNGIKDLTWLLFAPNLTHVTVSDSKEVEAIIDEKEVASVLKEEPCSIIPFLNLQYLALSGLPMLESIYGECLPFPCLKNISIFECPKLQKLPLNTLSVPNSQGFSITFRGEEGWLERVEWKDEATKERFTPFCKRDDLS